MRVKKMTIDEGRRCNISRFPNFHKTGSVRGMKRQYYGESALIVKCGSFYYKVDAETYDKATF